MQLFFAAGSNTNTEARNGNSILFNCILLLIYLSAVAFNSYHHELWGDEFHSWNIVKGSNSLADLFRNMRYEGHPPFWYLVLFGFSKFSHSLIGLKLFQFLFTGLAACLLVFYAPFSKAAKAIMLFGYYFIYEYAVLARNYMPAILIAFCIAVIFSKTFRHKILLYYVLLFALSNVHMLGLLLATSMHAAFVFDLKSKKSPLAKHIIAGLLLLLPAVYFIAPPSDSQLNLSFWTSMWKEDKLFLIKNVVVESLLPMPDFGKYNWWNTHLMTDDVNYVIDTGIAFVLFLAAMYYVLRKDKEALVLLTVNLILTYCFSLIFPLSTARYVGFVFISFIVAAWIADYKFDIAGKTIFIILLLIQIPAGFLAFKADYSQKFSHAAEVVEMEKKIPQGSLAVTDYWCLNILSAYLDKPFYCIEMNREISFLVWNTEMNAARSYNYSKGLEALLIQNKYKPFYYFSTHFSDEILKDYAGENMRLELVTESKGAVENSGNVYLYRVLVKW